jgi:hypothetical protein
MARNAEEIAMLAALMNENCESRIEIMQAFELGLITQEERDREFERLDNVFTVLNTEILAPDQKVCKVLSEDLVCYDPTFIEKNRAN